MANLPLSGDFRSIVTGNIPLIDVRAPVEFDKGAFPHAVNLPLMDDEERRRVGIVYKQEGNAKAVALGHRLVGGAVKEARIRAWLNFIDAHPDAMLYCFRGGQRSQIAQEWIKDSGREIVRLRGGYKAFRNYLMEETVRSSQQISPVVLGGRTGSGKTILLRRLSHAVDLEGLANHRGSSFGRDITPQPTLINFENALAYALIQKLDAGFSHLVFEDEGKCVGRLYLPQSLYQRLATAPMVLLETPFEERVEITFGEYVLHAQQRYSEVFGVEGMTKWTEDIREAMQRIQKRLGGLRYQQSVTLFDDALNEQVRSGSKEGYKAWAAYLLREYYDPMYDYQIAKNSERVRFRGSFEAVEAYLSRLR